MFTHAHVSMITYRVDVYRSRPTGSSLLCLTPKGLHTGAGWACYGEWRHVATGCTVLVTDDRCPSVVVNLYFTFDLLCLLPAQHTRQCYVLHIFNI